MPTRKYEPRVTTSAVTTTAPAKAMPKRRLRCVGLRRGGVPVGGISGLILRLGRLIAHPPYGEDQFGLRGISLDLRAKALHVHVYQSAVAQIGVTPDPLQQLITA